VEILTLYYKVLYLLAACQKYEMAPVQLSIRAEVSRGAFPEPTGVEAFTAYAIASAKQLIPETENAARQTLSQPMSFEDIGEGLRLFEGWALRDLVNFRKNGMSNITHSPFVSSLNTMYSLSKGFFFLFGLFYLFLVAVLAFVDLFRFVFM
jgi:hypothetical protein